MDKRAIDLRRYMDMDQEGWEKTYMDAAVILLQTEVHVVGKDSKGNVITVRPDKASC